MLKKSTTEVCFFFFRRIWNTLPIQPLVTVNLPPSPQHPPWAHQGKEKAPMNFRCDFLRFLKPNSMVFYFCVWCFMQCSGLFYLIRVCFCFTNCHIFVTSGRVWNVFFFQWVELSVFFFRWVLQPPTRHVPFHCKLIYSHHASVWKRTQYSAFACWRLWTLWHPWREESVCEVFCWRDHDRIMTGIEKWRCIEAF